jgi:predicted homoserine dehydrogenase-like protein
MVIDTLLKEREEDDRPIRVGIMAKGIVNQISNSVPGMILYAICNRNVEKAMLASRAAGLHPTPATAASSRT